MQLRAPPSSRLSVLPPVLATWGPGGKSEGHGHHAIHLVLARSGELFVEVGEARAQVRAAGVLTGPDVAHAIDARGLDVVLVFVEPESAIGEAIRARLAGPIERVDAPARDALVASFDALPAADPHRRMHWGATEIAQWMGVPRAPTSAGEAAPPTRLHPRVRRVLRALRELPPGADTSLSRLAEIAGLSESRLIHVFRESVGIPPRQYVLWTKLQRAVVAVATGAPLARAAVESGFTDASHMTRTFRRMFGMTPSMVQASVQRPQA